MTTPASLKCLRCGTEYPPQRRAQGCDRCTGELASNLRFQYRAEDVRGWDFAALGPGPRGMRRFSAMLPVPEDQLISLGEGDTPLHAADRLAGHLGLERLYVKDESRNPTSSYKDRLSVIAVSYARLIGAPAVATASSGNAGASLAAYAARAGLPCVVASMKGASGPMVSQIRKLGGHLVLMEDKTMRWPLLAAAAERFGWFITSPYSAPVVGSSPIGIEGYKTIAYEIFLELGRVPDWLALPVCYGDALAGIHQGFEDLKTAGATDRTPRYIAAEAHGSLRLALATRSDHVGAVPAGYAALAASVGAPQSAYQALLALRQADGLAVQVTNEGLIEFQERVGALEGLFLELASVMPFVAVRRLREQGVVASKDVIVCLATASGLKDVDKSTSAWGEPAASSGTREQILDAVDAAIRHQSLKLSQPVFGA